MAVVDYIILGTLLFSTVMGLVRGFLRQVFSLGGLLLGYVLGSMLYKPLSEFLSGVVTMEPRVAQIVAFALILIIVPIVFGFLGRLMSRVVRDAGLGIIDRLSGAVCGALVWLLMAGPVIRFMEMTGLSKAITLESDANSGKKASVLYAPVRDISASCLQWTWNKVKTMELPEFENGSKAGQESQSKQV